MKNSQKIILCCTVLFAFMASCHKKDKVEPDSTPKTENKKVYKMSSANPSEDDFYRLFSYNGIGKLIKADLDVLSIEYTYDNNNKIQGYTITYSDGSPGADASITYQSGGVKINYIISEFPANSGIPKDSMVFTYQQDNISNITHYFYVDMGMGLEYVAADIFQYEYDANGNLTRETHDSDGDIELFEYTYDNKNSPWLKAIDSTWDPIFGPISPNNVSSLTYTGTDGLVDQSESYTATYTYNSDDYPVTARFTYLDGTEEDYTLDYQ